MVLWLIANTEILYTVPTSFFADSREWLNHADTEQYFLIFFFIPETWFYLDKLNINQLDMIYCLIRVNSNIFQICHLSVIDKAAVYVCIMFIVHKYSLFFAQKHRASTSFTSHCGLFLRTTAIVAFLHISAVYLFRLCLSPAGDCDSAAWRTQWWATARIVGRLTTDRGTCIRGEHGWRTLSDVGHSLCV